MEQLKAVAEGLLEVETLDHDQFVQLYNGEKTPQELAEDLKAHMEKKKVLDEEEAAESAKLRKREERLAKKREMEEAAKAVQDKEGNGRFKPRLMTYNEVSKTAEPFDPDKLAKDIPEDEELPESYDDADLEGWDDADDDMPSEEELAVYDTDYLNADDEEEYEEEPEEDAEESADAEGSDEERK